MKKAWHFHGDISSYAEKQVEGKNLPEKYKAEKGGKFVSISTRGYPTHPHLKLVGQFWMSGDIGNTITEKLWPRDPI